LNTDFGALLLSFLKLQIVTRNKVAKNGATTTETRYFISSLPFREDENRTLEEQAAFSESRR